MPDRRILFVGDVVGKRGREFLISLLPSLKKKNRIDFTIVNGENAAGGYGLTKKIVEEFYKAGVDCITSGNHIWSKKEIVEVLEKDPRVLRPLNYPSGVPGRGYGIYEKDGFRIGVINILGRVFLDPVDSPFERVKRAIEGIKRLTPYIIVDFHAEATAEKVAMKYYIDGEVTALIGTHTHVQTSDEEVTERGMGYITDAGMTGPVRSVIGMDVKKSVERFLTMIPRRIEPAKGEAKLEGIIVEADDNGRCIGIKRIREYE